MRVFRHRRKKYAFVNERTVGGKVYRAYRNIDDPKDEILVIDGKTVKQARLKLAWRKIRKDGSIL